MYMPRTKDNPVGILILTKEHHLKASEARAIFTANEQPSEMQMQGIYNTIKRAALAGDQSVRIPEPAKGAAVVKILRDQGYTVRFQGMHDGPDQFIICW